MEKINFIDDEKIEIIADVSDPDDVMGSLNLVIADVVNLSGGIPWPSVKELEVKIISREADILEVDIITKSYHVSRVFNFADLIISNTYMLVQDKQRATATRLFCNEVISARQFGFQSINMTLMGKEYGAGWGGFYTFGRLGCQMILGDDIVFDKLMAVNQRQEKDIWELLQTEAGREFWLKNGFTWMGEFLLHDDGITLERLRLYLAEKGLDCGL